MTVRKYLTRFAVLAALVPALAAAATQEFPVDNVHSQLGFKVKHIVAKTPGRFTDYDGKIWMDTANIAKTLKIDATIKSASINTGNDKRDGHLRSADFFDAEKFPEIKFVSKTVTAKGDDTFEVVGDLTMKGVTKPVTLTVDYLGVATHPMTGTPTAGLDITGKVNRTDYGITWNKTLDSGGLLLGEDVNLDIHLEATVAPAEKKAG